MEELVQAVNKVADVVSKNNFWNFNIVGLLDIILSTILIFTGVYQYIQNQQLQKVISNRDSKNGLRNNILEIYSIFCTAFKKMSYIYYFEKEYLFNIDTQIDYLTKSKELCEFQNNINRAVDYSRLIFGEKEITNKLSKLRDLYMEYVRICRGKDYPIKYIKVVKEAWQRISNDYPEIQFGNIDKLLLNAEAKKVFNDLCIMEESIKANKVFEEYRELLNYENYDKFFEEYLKIKDI